MFCTFILKPKNIVVRVPKGTLISRALQKIYLYETFCGEKGICQRCKVLAEGEMSPKTEKEKNLPKGYRLACQTKIMGTVTVYNKNVSTNYQILTDIKLRKTELNRTGYGIAFDIGTTTIASYLVNLSNGNILSVVSAPNPQIFCGGDVISRIDWQNRHPNEKDSLRKYIIQSCNSLSSDLLYQERFKVKDEDVKAISFAGNTCMHHILMGLDTEYLGTSPYMPQMTERYTASAKELGIDLDTEALVFPNIAGFVGGDTVGAILSCMPQDTGETIVLLDIGTNGECALRHKGRLYVCSAAAGPAFEGGNISCGMGGTAGAIDKVWEEQGHIKFHTIDYYSISNIEPKGICGSGITDYISILLQLGYINKNGRIIKDIPNLAENISLSQKDIREFQMAKGSLSAAVKTLLATADITENDIDRIYLAGGFGNCINKESAKNIGLLPNISSEKIIPIGNGAAAGAILALLSEKEWQQTEIIQKEAIHIKLEESDIYKNLLMECLSF